ncbi:MAG: nucleotide pyrophosphohydrolase [Chloroflexota bacterium]|nr:nucleotide pyrophosphohydrolase [Chloroflexota bacterium]
MSDNTITLSELRAAVSEFVSERDWETYHTPKSLSMSIAIEAAELMELFQWHGNEQSRQAGEHEEKRTEAADELADVLIYCLAFANTLQLDISDAVASKLDINQRRYPPGKLPSRHHDLE